MIITIGLAIAKYGAELPVYVASSAVQLHACQPVLIGWFSHNSISWDHCIQPTTMAGRMRREALTAEDDDDLKRLQVHCQQ